MDKRSLNKAFLIVALTLLVSTVACYYMGNKDISVRVFNEQLGTYIIDTSKTNFGKYDIEKYKNLQIIFRKDSSFNLNMKVPFIYDSTGKWLSTKGGLEDWNWMFYKGNPEISTQFTETWTADSIFYMNSTTPQKGEEAISKIYFKKIKR